MNTPPQDESAAPAQSSKEDGRDVHGGRIVHEMDQPGISACRSRMATTIRLMEAMKFDSMESVRNAASAPYETTRTIGRAITIGMADLVGADVGGMQASVRLSVVPKKDWLVMRIEAACPPMLGHVVFEETVRNDLSNLFSPAEGKGKAIDAMRRLLDMVVVADAHMKRCVESGRNPAPTDPGTLLVRKHEARMSSLLTRAWDEHEEGTDASNVEFQFGNPYPITMGEDLERRQEDTITRAASDWLTTAAPSITKLDESKEGRATIYAFGGCTGCASTQLGLNSMEKLRLHALTADAPEKVLNEDWAESW